VTENTTLRERLRALEGQMASIGDENYDLKLRVRQLEGINEELRQLGGNRRTRREATSGPRSGK
jgi:hypothetical protein